MIVRVRKEGLRTLHTRVTAVITYLHTPDQGNERYSDNAKHHYNLGIECWMSAIIRMEGRMYG